MAFPDKPVAQLLGAGGGSHFLTFSCTIRSSECASWIVAFLK